MEIPKNKVEIAIQELKEAVKDLIGENEDVTEDLYLLRWLKARNMDSKKAEKMLRETIKWRRDNSIDELIEQDFNPQVRKEFVVKKATLKSGCPLTMMHAGKTDVKGIIERFGKESLYQFVVQHFVQEEKKGLAWNKQVFKASGANSISECSFVGNAFICDLKNINLKQLTSIKAFQLVSQLCMDYIKYFPGMGALCIITNCSRLALPFINVLKKIIEGPDLTIEIYGSREEEWRSAILKRGIDPDQLPTTFGGNLIVKEYL